MSSEHQEPQQPQQPQQPQEPQEPQEPSIAPEHPPNQQHAGADGYETDDSGFEDASVLTQSMRSSIFDYKFENGRRYHAYTDRNYVFPNDEGEQDRLDMQHRAMFLASGAKYIYAPVKEPQHILDAGTGTGIWAIEAAELYPGASFIGVDLSPIQPNWVPPNVKFEIDDLEDDWTWPPNHFDLVYSRLLLCGGICNFQKFFQQAFTHVKPGGFFEIQELSSDIRSDHWEFPEGNLCRDWCDNIDKGTVKLGRRVTYEWTELADLMRSVGFVDVVVLPFKSPMGRWPADPRLKEAGAMQMVAMLEGLEALSLAILSRGLGWSAEQVQVYLAHCRKEFCRKKTYMYWPCCTIYGRKPETAAATA